MKATGKYRGHSLSVFMVSFLAKRNGTAHLSNSGEMELSMGLGFQERCSRTSKSRIPSCLSFKNSPNGENYSLLDPLWMSLKVPLGKQNQGRPPDTGFSCDLEKLVFRRMGCSAGRNCGGPKRIHKIAGGTQIECLVNVHFRPLGR